ncbi:MAG: helix-turn-helix domain-containing protein [Acidobacteriota bacterium]
MIERSVLLASGELLGAEDIRLEMGPRGRAGGGDGLCLPAGMTLEEYEQSILREALKRASGNKSQAARLLGITRNALRYRLSQMGLEDREGEG